MFYEALEDLLKVLHERCLKEQDTEPLLKQIRHIEQLMKQLDSEEGVGFGELIDVLNG